MLSNRHILPALAGILLLSALGGCSLLRQELAIFTDKESKSENLFRETGKVEPGGVSGKEKPAAESVESGKTPAMSKEPEINRIGNMPPLPPAADRPATARVETGAPEQGEISLDFEQVELRQILELAADMLGITVVIDPTIADKITIRTAPDKPMRRSDLWPLLRMLLHNAGVEMEKQGEIYYVRKNPQQMPAVIGLAGNIDGGQVPTLQITPLRHIGAGAALNILRPLLGNNAGFSQADNLNLLGIAASPAILAKVNAILAIIDANPFQAKGMRLFRLQQAAARDVATELEKILARMTGEKSPYSITALERINALLVVVPPGTGFADIEQWVKILDAGDQDSNEQIFIYKVKNLDAEALAQTLSKSFPRTASAGQSNTTNIAAKSSAASGTGKNAGKNNPLPGAKPTTTTDASGLKEPPVVTTDASGDAPAGTKISDGHGLTIVPDRDTNSLLIRATPRSYRRLAEAILTLDRPPKQAMINVVIAEVTLTEATRFGVEWRLLAEQGRFAAHNVIGISGLLADSTLGRGLVVSNVGGELTTLLNFLGQKTDLKVLSRPSILVRNNQEAEITVGSEEPILTSITNTAETVAGSTQLRQDVQYRDTGIILKVTPQINDDGIINITVEQEVSQLGDERTIHRLPSFTNRKIKTSVVVQDNSAIVLGGIIQSRLQNGKTGIPGLMNIPLLGLLFSDTTVNEVRTELVLIIVPQLINPTSDNTFFMQSFVNRLATIKNLLEQEKYVAP